MVAKQRPTWKLLRIFCICSDCLSGACCFMSSLSCFAEFLIRALAAAIFCRCSAVSVGPPSRSTSALSRVTSVCSLKMACMSLFVACGQDSMGLGRRFGRAMPGPARARVR